MKSLFEQNGGTYRKQGDYLIPNLTLWESDENSIGIYGQRYLNYLQEQRKLTYINLLTSGKLDVCLADIDNQALNLDNQIRLLGDFSHKTPLDGMNIHKLLY